MNNRILRLSCLLFLSCLIASCTPSRPEGQADDNNTTLTMGVLPAGQTSTASTLPATGLPNPITTTTSLPSPDSPDRAAHAGDVDPEEEDSSNTIPAAGRIGSCFAFQLSAAAIPYVAYEETKTKTNNRYLKLAFKNPSGWTEEQIQSITLPPFQKNPDCSFYPSLFIDKAGVVYVAFRNSDSFLSLAKRNPAGGWETNVIVSDDIGTDLVIGVNSPGNNDYRIFYRNSGGMLFTFLGHDFDYASPTSLDTWLRGDKALIAYNGSTLLLVQRHPMSAPPRPLISVDGNFLDLGFLVGDFDLFPFPMRDGKNYLVVSEQETDELHLVGFNLSGAISNVTVGDVKGKYPAIASDGDHLYVSYSNDNKLWLATGDLSGSWVRRNITGTNGTSAVFRSAIQVEEQNLHILFRNNRDSTLTYLRQHK